MKRIPDFHKELAEIVDTLKTKEHIKSFCETLSIGNPSQYYPLYPKFPLPTIKQIILSGKTLEELQKTNPELFI